MKNKKIVYNMYKYALNNEQNIKLTINSKYLSWCKCIRLNKINNGLPLFTTYMITRKIIKINDANNIKFR